MARPRTIDDGTLLDHAEEAVAAEGMGGFTLRSVADRAGVSPATLVKRFGSRRDLLVAVSQRWVERVDAELDEVLVGIDDPVDRVRAVAVAWFADMDDPATVTNVVSALGNDLLDDELRTLLATGWARNQRRLEAEVAAARRAGALPHSPVAADAARLLFALTEGIRITWAVAPVGSLVARGRADVDVVLAGWTGVPSGPRVGGDVGQR